MNFLVIYLIGVCICGTLESILFNIESYYDYFLNKLEQVKQNMTFEEKMQLDNININHIITSEIITTSMFSWLGILYVIFTIIDYKFNN